MLGRYKGKPIFYGLGHFVFDLPGLDAALTPLELAKLKAMGEFAIYPREGYPLAPFHPDARKTMVAACSFDGRRMTSAGFVACQINEENHAVPVDPDSDDGAAIVNYMRQISEAAGLGTRYAFGAHKIGGYRVVTAAAA